MAIKIKICGMKFSENINEIASLQPDYLGFIFYEKSLRNFENNIPKLAESIQKVADTLANVRRDLNKLLVYLHKNKNKWQNDPIAFGIYHTFDIHTPMAKKNNYLVIIILI